MPSYAENTTQPQSIPRSHSHTAVANVDNWKRVETLRLFVDSRESSKQVDMTSTKLNIAQKNSEILKDQAVLTKLEKTMTRTIERMNVSLNELKIERLQLLNIQAQLEPEDNTSSVKTKDKVMHKTDDVSKEFFQDGNESTFQCSNEDKLDLDKFLTFCMDEVDEK
ncbi:uncharacterized protein LOC119679876 [Teleopsis dalmanni]|uniref:uncharacterized protein LOC119679876 n=2 Tax=Teleopsis dalmanni TaxID=139649 RepID=UPI0018CDFD3D|nr:uncharacterized protein LOC119679876 [Teleopsis dalmanni]